MLIDHGASVPSVAFPPNPNATANSAVAFTADPVFAALAAEKIAEDRFCEGAHDDPEVSRVYFEVVRTTMATIPTTAAGLIALVDRYEESVDGSYVDSEKDGLKELLATVRAFVAPGRTELDTRLRQLVADLVAAEVESDRVCDLRDEACGRYRALGGRPPVPEALFKQDDDATFCIPSSVFDRVTLRHHVSDEAVAFLRRAPRERIRTVPHPDLPPPNVRGIREPWQEAQARADEIVAAWDAREAEHKRRRELAGLVEGDAAWSAGLTALRAAQVAVIREPACTMDGVLLKAAVLRGWFGSDFDSEIENPDTASDHALGLSIARDLLTLAPSDRPDVDVEQDAQPVFLQAAE